MTKLLSQAKGKQWFCNNRCQAMLNAPPGTVAAEPNPYRAQKATRPCAECGTPVTHYLSPKKIRQTWYCSSRCRGKGESRKRMQSGAWEQPRKPRRGDTVACLICGTEFYRQPAFIKENRRFCSKPCAWKGQLRGQVRECAYCGKERYRPPSQTSPYCTRLCEQIARIKRPLSRLHNGRPARLNDKGYVLVWEPKHPKAMEGWMFEHRLVVEQLLGRYLSSDEQVDHINQIKSDNRPDNLQVLDGKTHAMKTNAENLGALAGLRAKVAEYERKFGQLP